MNASSEKYDVVVIGGGPGGSTLASLVSMQGHRVLLLEKQRFPRHQIGESLLPSTVHGICRLLGVTKQLDDAGFMRKRGGTFLWGRCAEPWTFAFSERADSPTGYAYQVERSKFDKILLDNAAALGVEVREESAVTDVLLENGRVAGVKYCASNGGCRQASATFVVDASGHQSTFYRFAGKRIQSKVFQNVAAYAYFRDGKRLPEPNAGNILCVAFPDGWFWYIPLSRSLTSVGIVVAKENAGAIRNVWDEKGHSFVDKCPLIRDFLGDASRITEGPYGVVRVRKDYSYCNTAFYRDGLILVGDAACFVDPVLSSGVHLATYSGLLAARSINTALEGHLREDVCLDEFEYRYRREFGNFYQFLTAFYDMHKDEQSYYWEARKVLGSEEGSQAAFIKLVAGLSPDDENVFPSGPGQQVSHGLGEWFGKLQSAEKCGRGPSSCRTDVKGFDFDTFLPGISSEMTQVQLQALMGHERGGEHPLRRSGLVPSADGFHWSTPVAFQRNK